MSSKDEERRKRLAALGAKREIPTPEGEARMSAVIQDVAEPLLKQHGKTPERAKAVLMLVTEILESRHFFRGLQENFTRVH